MPDNKGLLLVTMEPPAGLEDEFNDWYDTEHFPQRRALPGFESASRWVCLAGWPRWVAVYDMASVAAVETPEYRAVSGPNSTPWSRRLLPRTIGRSRIVAEQVAPGYAASLAPGVVSQLLIVGFAGVPADRAADLAGDLGLKAERLDGLRQFRLFRGTAAAANTFWALAEFDRPVGHEPLAQRFGEAAGIGARTFNLYAPYHRG
jgi:hypothetical protein